MYDVGERFINKAARFWWVYKIAYEFKISPQEVKQWDADEVLETLAAIGLMQRGNPSEGGQIE